ncbi:hypothetical protein P3X46_014646 [Hevea brasiliensis]|uniref:TF-B3 domain-containing protein n=1 Tax=Hevea brasiliensis TaxID=3981 RepID=A0ABQ9LTC4_HEVBR|nr:hypothetical protein P3X46_014646 [Hevea brasiliensis]
MAIFSKSLTKTDITKKLSFPTKSLKYLPCFGIGHALDLHVRDESGHVWTFRCIIRKKNHPKPVLTKGWRKFASSKHLDAGDKIIFYEQEDEATGAKYKIEVKKSIKLFGAILGYLP